MYLENIQCQKNSQNSFLIPFLIQEEIHMENNAIYDQTVKIKTRIYGDGSQERKIVSYSNTENKDFRKQAQEQNTRQKRYRRAVDRLLAFKATHFVSLTVPETSSLRYDSRALLNQAEKFFIDSGVKFAGVLEAYDDNSGYHIHALVDNEVNLFQWKHMTNASLRDCYCRPIKHRVASAKYMAKNVSKLPKNTRHFITNVPPKRSSYQVERNNVTVFQNAEAKRNHSLQTEYLLVSYENQEFMITVPSIDNSLASANLIIKDFCNSIFKCTNINIQEQYRKSLNEGNSKVVSSNISSWDTLGLNELCLIKPSMNTLDLCLLNNRKQVFYSHMQLLKPDFKYQLNHILITAFQILRTTVAFHISDLNFLRPP